MLSTWFHRDRDYVSHPFTLVLMFAVINLRVRHERRREPSSEAKEERVLLLVYLLVDGTCGDPSIIALLGSDGAHINAVPANRNPFQDF